MIRALVTCHLSKDNCRWLGLVVMGAVMAALWVASVLPAEAFHESRYANGWHARGGEVLGTTTACSAGLTELDFELTQYDTETRVNEYFEVEVWRYSGGSWTYRDTLSGTGLTSNTICFDPHTDGYYFEYDGSATYHKLNWNGFDFFPDELYSEADPESIEDKRIRVHGHVREKGISPQYEFGLEYPYLENAWLWLNYDPTYEVEWFGTHTSVHGVSGIRRLQISVENYDTGDGYLFFDDVGMTSAGVYSAPALGLPDGWYDWFSYLEADGQDGGGWYLMSEGAGYGWFVIDRTPPNVAASHTPVTPTDSDTVSVSGSAQDLILGLQSIEISVDGTVVETCSYSGTTATSTCTATGNGPYAAGSTHTYEVRAEDRLGNATIAQSSFTVDGPPPAGANTTCTIAVNGDPIAEGDNTTVTITIDRDPDETANMDKLDELQRDGTVIEYMPSGYNGGTRDAQTSGLSSGDYTYTYQGFVHVYTDPVNYYNDTFTCSDTLTVNTSLSLPDLEVLSIDTGELVVDTPADISHVVANDDAAEPTDANFVDSYRYNYDGDPSVFLDMATSAIPALKAGEQHTDTIQFTPTQAGDIWILVCADHPADDILETDDSEDDNCWSQKFFIESPPQITFYADPNPIITGGDTTLTWDLSGTIDTCYANNTVPGHNWTTGQSKGSDTSVVHTQSVSGLTSDTQFTLRCDGPGGTFDEKSVLVDVVEPPIAYLEACRWDGSAATDCTTAPDSLLIAEGDEILVSWNGGSDASTTCEALSGKDFDTNDERAGSQVIDSLTTADHPETYEVECSNIAGSERDSVEVRIGTACLPLSGLEGPSIVRAGEDFTLRWQKPVDIATCLITGGPLSIEAAEDEPDAGQCTVIDEYPVSVDNKTQFTMSCDYPPLVPNASVEVVPRLEEI